jgi:hypothetical protein
MPRNREDHGNISGVNLLSSGNAARPGQTTLAQGLAKRRAHAVSGVSQHAAMSCPLIGPSTHREQWVFWILT